MTSEGSNQFPLPAPLRDIADVTDYDTAMTIALKRRGTRLYIPQSAEGSVLEDLVGIDAARKIVDELSNSVIDVPMVKKLLAFWLREQNGWSLPKIANALGTSPRTLQYWYSGQTPSRSQPDLFDEAS